MGDKPPGAPSLASPTSYKHKSVMAKLLCIKRERETKIGIERESGGGAGGRGRQATR